jgi:hypothetical protein
MRRLTALSCALAFALSAAAGEKRIEDYLPADSLVALCYYGDNPAMRETALAKLLAEDEVKVWLESVRTIIAGGNQLAAQFLQVNAAYLQTLLDSQVGLSLALGQGPMPDILVVAKVGGPDATGRRSIDAFLKQIEAKLLGGAPAPKIDLNGVQVTRLGPGGLNYGYRDGFLFLGTTEMALSRALAADTPKLSGSQVFQRTIGLEGTPVGMFAYNHKRLMGRFGPMMPPMALGTLQTLGLDGVESIGVRFAAKGRALVGGAWVQVAGERRGLLKALTAGPVDRSLLKLIPRDASIAMAMNIDAAEMFQVLLGATHSLANMGGVPDVRGELAAFEARAGVSLERDVFGNLEQGTVLTSSGASFLPALILSQGAKDPAKFEAAMARLVVQLDGFIKNVGGQGRGAELRTIAFGDRRIRYVAMPGVPMPLAPCFAEAGGRVVFALTPVHLKDYLAFLDEGGPSIVEAPGFQKLLPSVPKDASLISYSRAGEDFIALYETIGPFLTLAQGIPNNPIPVDLANLPATSTLRKHLFDGVSYVVARDGMLLYQCESPFGFEVMAPAPLVLVTALGAGVLVPRVAHARGEARAVHAMNNQRQIGMAIMMYLQANGTYPKSLMDLMNGRFIGDNAVFVALNDPDPPAMPNGVRCSFESVFDRHPDRAFGQGFPANQMILWDRRPFNRGMRSVTFADAHIERMPEGVFQQRLLQLDAFVKENVPKRKEGGEL